MNDLFDIARPIRDAAVQETLRMMSDDVRPADRDGAVLGSHLVAVIMAWGSARHDVTHGTLRDPDLMNALGYAVGLLLGNAGLIYRATSQDGSAIPPTRSVSCMVQRAVPVAMHLARMVEHGCADVSLPFGRQADGTLGVEKFDIADMLGRAKP